MHGLADRDIGGRSAGYGSPEVGGPSPPTRSTLLSSVVVDVIHDMIRSYVEAFRGRIELLHLRKIALSHLESILLCSRGCDKLDTKPPLASRRLFRVTLHYLFRYRHITIEAS